MSKQKQQLDTTAVEARDLRIYRLKITIGHTDPAIWRRLEVYAGIEMDSLATAIETSFGWSGEHLGGFTIKGRTIGDDSGWGAHEGQFLDDEFRQLRRLRVKQTDEATKRAEAKRLVELISAKLQAKEAAAEQDDGGVPTLCDLVPRVRTKFTYTYDFGDDWKHLIEVENIAPAEPGVRYPRCTDGARGNPVEDCGGPWGFAELVEAAGNPKHERFADLVEWGLEKWDPAKFSIEQADRKLARIFRLRK